MTTIDLDQTLAQVEAIVREAGAILRKFHDQPDHVDWKGENDPVTAADRAVNTFLVERLHAAFPDFGILAEESKDDLSRLEKDAIWCIDPLDGTKEFIARNGEFSIMVGLALDELAVLGVVYQPVKDFMYSGIRTEGAWLTTPQGRTELHVSDIDDPARMRLVVSRSHRNPIVDDIKQALGISQERISGSVGLKCGLIARGEADLYLHPAPGIKEWDTCAPEAILFGAGGRLTDCWGRPLLYNQPDVHRHFGLVASNDTIHAEIIARLVPVLEAQGLDINHAW
ncbi:MAG TPA: 3'(2'),5'-bisphosphate nucleotidase CysQ [Anaerolineae bacterium]|nr:3'(2'),5'-bisphosphate nucleotidase CysQ [Anaerolineae bacterium]